MRSQCAALFLLALLVSANASPHDEDFTTISAAKVTKTVVVTITHTADETSTTRAPLPTDPALICPTPNLPCIVDGIPIWPNSTSVPKFTLDPSGYSTLKTTMSSSATSFSHHVSLSTDKHTKSTMTSSASQSTMSSMCDHSMSHMAPSEGNSTSWTTTITEPVDQSSTSSITLLAASNTATALKEDSANAAKTTTDVLDSAAWAGIDGALMTRSKRNVESSAQRRRKMFWSRLFVAAYPQTPMQIVHNEDGDQDDFAYGNEPDVKMDCVQCPKGRSIVCIDGGYYGHCDEGCAEPRKLKEGMKCVDGRIYGIKMYHDGA